MTPPKEFAPSVTLGAFTGSSTGHRLEVRDRASGVLVLELTLTHEELGLALASQSVDLSRAGTLYSGDRVGLQHEVMKVAVPDLSQSNWGERTRLTERVMRDVGLPPEDGWAPHFDDRYNGHRRGDDGYRVAVHRWVAPSATSDAGEEPS